MTWGFLGSPWAVRMLQEHIARGRVHHAYLFTGPPGVGRRTLALRFAQALLCQQPPRPGQMCGRCRACRYLETTLTTGDVRHPDVTLVEAGVKALGLQVGQVREALHVLTRSPQMGPYRIALFLDFDRATPAAANALLKTLEEPNPGTVLLLTAEAPETVLPTVASRCQPVPLRPMGVEALAQALQAGYGASPEVARRVAAWAGGRPGYALRLLRSAEAYQQHEGWLQLAERVLASPYRERLQLAQNLVKETDRRDLVRPLFVWAAFWRDALHVALGHPLPLFHPERMNLFRRLAQHAATDLLYRAWQETLQAPEHLRRYVSPRLLFEALFLGWPRLAAG